MTNEELIENYPVYMDNRHDLKLCRNAFLEPFPKKDSLDYSVLCETGITFSKGGMPFHATFKHDYERDDDYFDITPYGKDTPHLTLYSNKIEYPLTLESMQYELEEVVDTAFYDGRLDAQEIEPHPYSPRSMTSRISSRSWTAISIEARKARRLRTHSTHSATSAMYV